ncbi:hypothetical protein DYB28_000358 [Aphanomyces astaci]|uniref:Uncharacterized protein n=1 Tax=Aphanomyces astaci TaxID=112090 RepID=A0A3L6VY99_APHAT|nr:hypothetical protein DYB26_003678 [Aphanomyces astaci]RLO13852.1 hypothetical protein DYB28_000358 [Aphanomyces astaci]
MAVSVLLPSEEPAAAQAAEDVDMGFDDAVKVTVQFDTKILDADSRWLRQFAIGYQLYGGMVEEKPSKPPAEEPRKENSWPLDGMLVDALKQRRVWDMAEAGDADQTSANVKPLQEAFQEDPEDALYTEDVACSTPAMEKPADQDGEISVFSTARLPRPSSLASPLRMKANSVVFWMITPMSFAWSLGKACRWKSSR